METLQVQLDIIVSVKITRASTTAADWQDAVAETAAASSSVTTAGTPHRE
ncbi:hypothetical protein [Streptomyces sp. NPDC056061]